jgi:hypothetical protein
LSLATRVASLVNTEYKVLDSQTNYLNLGIVNNATPATDGFSTIYDMCNIPLGDEMNQRNGRSVLCKSLQLRINGILQGNLDHVNIRLICLRYKGNTNATITVPQVYAQPTNATDWVRAFREVFSSDSQAYQIMWDKSITMDKDFKSEVNIDKYFKMKSHIKFRQPINDWGRMFFFCFFDNLATDGTFNLSVKARIRYLDN